MGNEHDRCFIFLLQTFHQAEDLRLNGDVQSGRRFIRNQQCRITDPAVSYTHLDKTTLFSRPMHPYTEGLMAAVPIPDFV